MKKPTTQPMQKTTEERIQRWLTGDYDAQSKAEIRRLQQENPEELADAFYTDLVFGTGGLRGIMGVGPNRMNLYTVRGASQGLANYLKRQPLAKGCRHHTLLIGYDNRANSRLFAEEAAMVFAANGIAVLLYSKLRPVALLSFGLLWKRCQAGVLITASHNPPQYNGYKVYWSDGAQVLPPHDVGIIEEVRKISDLSQIKTVALDNPLISFIGDEIETAYLQAIAPLIHPQKGSALKIVYTPLHGTGMTIVPQALRTSGFTTLSFVEAQTPPDPAFSYAKDPNPEDAAALALGVQQLTESQSDILLATDPDADRLAVVALHKGEAVSLTGNEIASLLLEYLLSTRPLPPRPACIKTIVTTELLAAIAKKYGVVCLDVLTGFKYIGQKIDLWSRDQAHHFLFGCEESYGYLAGTHARDKDAILSAVLISELALEQKRKGQTLVDALYALYATYGVYREKVTSHAFPGQEGHATMEALMERTRNEPPKAFNNIAVVSIEDFLTQSSVNLESGQKERLSLPPSNVLRFWLRDGTKVVIRPSGTEPKIKVYCGACVKGAASVEKGIQECDRYLAALLPHVLEF